MLGRRVTPAKVLEDESTGGDDFAGTWRDVVAFKEAIVGIDGLGLPETWQITVDDSISLDEDPGNDTDKVGMP